MSNAMLNTGIVLCVFGLVGFAACTQSKHEESGGDSSLVEEAAERGGLPFDFELVDLDGRKRRLADYRGKLVLLNFWATWCPGCLEEMPALERLYALLKDEGFIVIGINVDEAENQGRAREFAKRTGLSFPVLFDADGDSPFRYGVSGFPESFLISRSGKFLSFSNPRSGEAQVRVVGEHPWDSVKYVEELRKHLAS